MQNNKNSFQSLKNCSSSFLSFLITPHYYKQSNWKFWSSGSNRRRLRKWKTPRSVKRIPSATGWGAAWPCRPPTWTSCYLPVPVMCPVPLLSPVTLCLTVSVAVLKTDIRKRLIGDSEFIGHSVSVTTWCWDCCAIFFKAKTLRKLWRVGKGVVQCRIRLLKRTICSFILIKYFWFWNRL